MFETRDSTEGVIKILPWGATCAPGWFERGVLLAWWSLSLENRRSGSSADTTLGNFICLGISVSLLAKVRKEYKRRFSMFGTEFALARFRGRPWGDIEPLQIKSVFTWRPSTGKLPFHAFPYSVFPPISPFVRRGGESPELASGGGVTRASPRVPVRPARLLPRMPSLAVKE